MLNKKLLWPIVASFSVLFISPLTLATPPAPAPGIDLSSLTGAVNFTSVLTGIMAVAGSLIVLYAGFAGVKWILRMVKSA